MLNRHPTSRFIKHLGVKTHYEEAHAWPDRPIAAAPVAGAGVRAKQHYGSRARQFRRSCSAGVTVEASSPVLIEGVRTAVTDDRGAYRIIELRPGAYTVAFSRCRASRPRAKRTCSFQPGFTATVNSTLSLGTVEETITVTREVSSVDTVNIAVRDVLPQAELDALPLGESIGALRSLVVGAVYVASRQDVGGNQGENQQNFAVNGGRAGDFQQYRDGMLTNSLISGGQLAGQPESIHNPGNGRVDERFRCDGADRRRGDQHDRT